MAIMSLSPKQKIILGTGTVAIIGLLIVRKKILGAITTAQVPPPTPPNAMVPGMGEDPTAFDKVAKTTNTAIQTLTGAIALTMGYFTLKEKKQAVSAKPAPVAVVAAPVKRARKRSRR